MCLKTCLHCLFWISYFKEQREIQPITKMNYYNSKINRVQINSFVFHLIILIRLHNNSIPLAQRQNINKNGGVRLGEETPNPKGLREVYSWHKAIIFLCFGFYLDEIFVKINTTKTKHSVFNTADFICRHGSDSHRTFFFLDPRKSKNNMLYVLWKRLFPLITLMLWSYSNEGGKPQDKPGYLTEGLHHLPLAYSHSFTSHYSLICTQAVHMLFPLPKPSFSLFFLLLTFT